MWVTNASWPKLPSIAGPTNAGFPGAAGSDQSQCGDFCLLAGSDLDLARPVIPLS
jgi:hypothetical protein